MRSGSAYGVVVVGRRSLAVASLICSLLARISPVGTSKLNGYSPNSDGVYHGRYTRDIREAELLIPWQVHEDGTFHTYELTKFYDRREIDGRRKRSTEPWLHLVLPFADGHHHVELEPYHDFISPGMVIETRSIADDNSLNLDEGQVGFKWPSDRQCHYRGRLRGHGNSRAALSLCDGVAGYVHTNNGRYFIEPLHGDEPDADGQHIHVAYKKDAPHENSAQTNMNFCGTNDDWESAWTEQLERLQGVKADVVERPAVTIDEKRASNEKAPSSSTHSVHRYIEIGLVADRQFLDFHNGTNYEQYLLTIMNMVSDFYHDASVGNQIDVVVVRMIYLEKERNEVDLSISTNGEKTLESFANWIQKLNPEDPEHPNHFDVGTLVTRYDICAEGNNCNLLGLAYVAAACERKKAACINEDSGLLLGIVIAHELGHTLGCSHDTKEISGCQSQDKDKSFFVMSPIVFIYTVRWSTCSRKFITSFLESGLGECLNNNPKNPPDKYKYPGMLPGAMYDAAFQCKLAYPGSKPCETGEEDCEDLWCNVGGNNCKSKGAPPADGTKCAENKWCVHKKCVNMGSRGDAVNGGWGGWGKLGSCSRTCGGGVQFAERECNKPVPKNGGRYCVGERKKFATCNTKSCDTSKPSFRAVQCTEHNKKPSLPGGPHKWQPYLRNDLESCALYCINQANTFTKLSPTAKDGTPCKTGTYDMCIGGVCRKVGCDWVIDSDAIEDVCGVCKGSGTKCTRVEGAYKEAGKPGYNTMVVVPKGSTNILAYERGAHVNTLAVKLAKKKNYCLNGDLKEQESGDYKCTGSTIIYNHVEKGKEEIRIKGPIKEDVEIQYVFYKGTNPGVHYEYYINTPDKSYVPKYSWEFIEWSDCDAKCGGGTKISEASCVEARAGKVVPNFCKGMQKPPPKSQICNKAACPAKWRVSQWSRCSGCGGKSGEMRRKIQCVRPGPHQGDDYVQANLEACKGSPPPQTKKCVGTQPCRKICPPKTVRNSETSVARAMAPEDSIKMIDELVDYGLARYLERSKGVSISQDFKPASNNYGDSVSIERLLRDWVGLEEEANKEKKRRCRDSSSSSCSSSTVRAFTTPVPGSIVIDSIPSLEIAVYEAPLLSSRSSRSSSSNSEEQLDDMSSIDASDMQSNKVYKSSSSEMIKRRLRRDAGSSRCDTLDPGQPRMRISIVGKTPPFS